MSYAYTNAPHIDKNEEPKPFTKVNKWTGYYPYQKKDAVCYDEYVEKYEEYLNSLQTGEIFDNGEEEEEQEEEYQP